MCGIAGGFGLGVADLEKTLERLQHRGPDGVGTFFGDGFSMGMRRLAIQDLEHGQQPFALGSVQVVCNGEIYNWRELRAELETAGFTFSTECDCEILPAAWCQWGKDMVPKLIGMFALAVFDQESGELFLARDRCGEKPLFWRQAGPGSFHFSSEAQAFSASQRMEEKAATQWLRLRYCPEPLTVLEGIQTVPAAHWMKVRDGKIIEKKRYWTPPVVTASQDQTSLADLTAAAVNRASQPDVPMACYLSGGVDSALLAHFLKKTGRPFQTIAIGFGAQSDETASAAETAAFFDLPHHTVTLPPESLQSLPRVVSQMDLPIGDALLLAFDALAKKTADLGCKVALGGEGPDEHFGGYSFQSATRGAARLGSVGRFFAAKALKNLPLSALSKLAAFPAEMDSAARYKIVRYLETFGDLSPFERLTGLHTLEDAPGWFFQEKIPPPRDPELPFDDERRSLYTHWLPDWSLIRQDRMTMAHGVEYRAPFLDRDLMDEALRRPFSKEKRIWRELADQVLPKPIARRPKQPFYLPLEHPAWRDQLVNLAQKTLPAGKLRAEGILDPDAVTPLLAATTFLPLKKLAALVIFQLWLDQLSD